MASISKTEGQLGKSGIGIILAVLVIIVIGVVYFATKDMPEQEMTVDDIRLDEETVAEMSESGPPRDASFIGAGDSVNDAVPTLTFNMEGKLFDVTDGNATGVVMSTFENDTYYLHAEMENLPDPSTFGEGYFYEGWLVRRESLHVLSTGVVSVDENGYGENTYSSGQDWSDHDFYVLTIEPNDGDPAPYDHILEGVMMAK